MANTATIAVGDKTIELPVLTGSEGEVAIDIRKLRQSTGMITLDPGYGNTGSCTSGITFIHGEKGILRHRGYAIEDLTDNSSFLEVAMLLLEGELPSKTALADFTHHITHHTMVHEDVHRFYAGFPKDAHPMAVAGAVIAALSTFYPDSRNPTDDRAMEIATHRLIAKLPTIVAYSYKHSKGQPIIYPRTDLSYAANFLHMLFATPAEPYEVNPKVARAMDLFFMLHGDHEQNCSASTVRMVGSSQANLFAAISAGVFALWGPLHGGANVAVIDMLEQIRETGDGGVEFLQKVKDKKTGVRLMGFGHRVYKNFDPRATILKKACFEVFEDLKLSNPLLDIALELEEAALKDDYFIERKLFPNVDFYSGVLLQSIGLPTDMFTTLFTIGRLPGWIAQWREMIHDPETRIARPRQVYVGPTEREYVSIDQR